MINLYNKDCMEFMSCIEDNYYDLAIVDPPYGINADENHRKRANVLWKGKSSGQWKKYNFKKWDYKIPENDYFIQIDRVSKKYIIWGGNYYDINVKGVIVWNKGENGTLPHGEMAKSNIKTFKIFHMTRTDAYINNEAVKIHPTQKPVELYRWLLKNYAKKGDKIFDSHGGSGSICIACHDMGFDLDWCELDKDYYIAAKNRYDKHISQLRFF